MDEMQNHQLLATISATLVGLIFIATTMHFQTINKTFKELKEQIPDANLRFPYYILISLLSELIILFIPLYVFLTLFLFEDNNYIKLLCNSIIIIVVLCVVYTTKDYFRGNIVRLVKLTKVTGFLRLVLIPIALISIILILFFERPIHIATIILIILGLLFVLPLKLRKGRNFFVWVFTPIALILIAVLLLFEKSKIVNPEIATIISSISIILGLLFVFWDVFLSQSGSLILLVDRELIDIIRKYMSGAIKETAVLQEAIKEEEYKFGISNDVDNIVTSLNNGRIPEKLKEYFQNHGIDLHKTVEVEKIDNEWEIDGYFIKKENGNKLNIYEPSLDKKKIEKAHERMKYFIDNVFPLVIDSNTIIASELMLQLELRDVFIELRNKYRIIFY